MTREDVVELVQRLMDGSITGAALGTLETDWDALTSASTSLGLRP